MGFLILNHDSDAFRQERYIRDLNLEFKNIIELAESAKSAQVAAATSHKKSRLAENTLPKNGLINHFLAMPLSAQRAQEMSAGSKYYRQGEPRNSDY